MPPTLLKLLQSYSAIFDMGLMRPEKYGTADHPNDRTRWHRFVIACHRHDEPISEHEVQDALEALKWPHDNAWARASLFQQQSALLKLYDEELADGDATDGHR
jgi:hypothetical protein